MPVSSSTTDRSARLTRWLVTAPPAVFLVIFFLIPALIMAGASFREPGEFGGPAPLAESGPSLDAYRFILDHVIYAWIPAQSLAAAVVSSSVKRCCWVRMLGGWSSGSATAASFPGNGVAKLHA